LVIYFYICRVVTGSIWKGKPSQGIIFDWRQLTKSVKIFPTLEEISWHNKYTRYAVGRSTTMTLRPLTGLSLPIGLRGVPLFPEYSAGSGTGIRPTAG
jgi:hypothetical protein